jgi:hypothetical protein
MRKLFWSCAAVAVAAAGTVYLAAKHVDQHPYAVMGQTVRSMCGTEHETGAAPAGETTVPAEPTPSVPSSLGAAEPAHEVVAVAGPSLPCHITVGESDSAGSMSSTGSSSGDANVLTGYTVPAPSSPSGPLVMPYCCDESHAPQHMPYADEESCEPSESSCADEPMGLFQFLKDLLIKVSVEPMTVDPMPADSEPMGSTLPEGFPSGKCEEDDHYHQHCPVCPYTGRCYPEETAPSPAVPDLPEEKNVDKKSSPKKDTSEETSPAPKHPAGAEPRDNHQAEFHLDTMEFRPSDAGLHRFIPGAL